MTTEPDVFEVEGTSGDLVQSLCSNQSELQQVAQRCVQLGFEYLHGQRLHNLGGQP